MGKKLKFIISFLVWALAALAFFYTLVQILNPSEHTEENTVYSADISSTMEYTVRLNDTLVFNRAKDADIAKYYIMPFTDYVSIDCSYNLSSQTEALISSESYVAAFLVSYIDDGSDEVILWKKEYPLADNEAIEATGTNLSSEKNVKIEFTEYSELIDQIYETYNFKTNYYIMVVYTTEFVTEYSGITKTKIMQPYIRIDIEDFLFSISQNSVSDTKIEIYQEITVADEVSWNAVIVGSAVFILLAILAIILPSRIVSNVQLSNNSKEIKKINVKYGDRIVNIAGKPDISQKTAKVNSVEDLIKISDEISQPVFCAAIDNEVYYYVVNSDIMYYIMMPSA